MRDTVLTIGHSTHPLERFVSLLRQHEITALCDVRSRPYSRVSSQFNREELKECLRAFGIKYVFLGKELGARSEDTDCYEDGKVQYERLAQTDLFQLGLSRVQRGLKEYRLVLMCAEREPLACHRAILVARHLATRGVTIQHVHADGSLEDHDNALRRLAKILNLRENEHDFFRSRQDLFAEAYRLQEKRIAYDSNEALPTGIRAFKSAAG
jgi:uncharacterized protein (DUF488 family)